MNNISFVSKSLHIAYLSALALAACSSGTPPQMGQAEKPAGTLPPAPPVTSVRDYSGGYLYGNLYLDDASNSNYPIQILMSEDGRFRALQAGPYSYPQTYLLLSGSFALDDRQIYGEGIAIADPGQTWSDGESVTAITISGTLDQPTYTSNGKLLISLSMASGDSGRIDASYASLSGYWYGSDLQRLEGKWGAAQNTNGSWHPDPYGSVDLPLPPAGYVEFVVTQGGEFSGTDGDGCETAGRFSLIDTRYSLWSVDYTISNCDRAGNYSGLALGDNHWYDTRSLSFSADDGTRSQSLDLWQVAP
jgi:hypothetical protein